MSARRPFLSATLAKATASKRASIRLIGPTVPSPGTKSTSRSPAPKASPTSSRERQLADTAGVWVHIYEFRQSEIADPSALRVAVGTTITDRPPHRSVQARLRI